MRALRAYLTTPASLFAIAVAVSMVMLDFFAAAFGLQSIALFQWWVYLSFALTAVALFGLVKLVLRRPDGWRYVVAIGVAGAIQIVLALPSFFSPGRLLARLITG